MNHHQACNDLLRKRNNLIATLESEIRESDDQYKTLIEEFHENTSVLAARMEQQVSYKILNKHWHMSMVV